MLNPQIPPQRPARYLSYQAIEQWVDSIAPLLRDAGFVAIAALLRGGLFPAQCASFATGAPLVFMRYQRTARRASWCGEPPPAGRILLCEDIAGCGHTLADAMAFVRQTHADFRVLTVVSDERSRIRPDWSMSLPGVQSVLPWEREVVSPRFQHDWSTGGAEGRREMGADHAYRYWAVDLDGVLCEDLAAQSHRPGQDAAPAESDRVPRARSAPQLSRQHHVIVTGRPLQERARTRRWLDARGYGDIAVWHRDPARHGHDDASVAAHKSWAARQAGATDFIASCPHQAVAIAAEAPHMRVYWWRQGQPLLVSAMPAVLPGLPAPARSAGGRVVLPGPLAAQAWIGVQGQAA